MNDHSRTKRSYREAIIFHRPSRDLDQLPGQFLTRPRKRIQLSGRVGPDLFIVSKAYQEPGGSDCIEDILLHRDYIID